LPDNIAIWEGIQLNVEIVYCICKFPCIFGWFGKIKPEAACDKLIFAHLHCSPRGVDTPYKSLAIFPTLAGMSLTKLTLGGNILIIPAQEGFDKGHPGWGRECR
jgi:hypothetical protein